MAITFVSQGTTPTAATTGTGTTSVTAATPASMASGDLVLLVVGNKPDTSTPTTPTNWTLAGSVAGGAGIVGADTGPVRTTVFYRIYDGVWTLPAVTITSNSGAWAQAFAYRNSSGLWDIAAAGGADSTTGAAWSVTAASDPGFVANDWAFVASTTPTDVAAGAQFTLESIASTGITYGTMTERSEPSTSQGNDVGGLIFDRPVTSGTSSAAPVVTATVGSTTTNVAGTSVVVRLRDALILVSTTDKAAINIAEDSGTGGPPADNTYTYEEGTDGVAIASGSNGVVAAGASNIYSSTAAIHGSLGMQMGDATNSGSLGYASPAASFTASVYFKIHASTAGATVIASARNGSSHLIRLSGNGTTSRLELRDSGSTVYATSASTFVTDTLYRADFRIDNALTTSAAVTIRLFIGANAEGSVPDDILSGTIPVASVPSRFYWGSSTAVWVTYNDTVRLYNQINSWPTGYAAAPTGNGVINLVSATDSCAVTISDVSSVDTGSTAKSGTEAPAVTIAETSSVAVTQPTVDTTAVTIAESRTLAGSSTSTDACAVTISETSSVAVTQPTTDTAAVTIAETSSVSATQSTTDTAAITIAETSAPAVTQPTTDTSAITIAEARTLAGSSTSTDSCAVTISETSSVSVTQSSTDTAAITIAETSAVTAGLSTTDTSAITIAETSSVAVTQPTTDTAAVTISETSAAAVTQPTTDTSAITIAETSSVAIVTAVSTTDTTAVSAADTSSVAAVQPTTDTSAITIAETSSVAVTQPTTDTAAVTIAETSSIAITQPTTDTSAITISETSSVSVTQASTDTTAITIAESSSVAITNALSTTDTTAITIAETSAPAVSLSRTDTCAITIAETASQSTALSTTDTSAITIADASTSSSTLSRTDAASVTISDNSNIATPLTLITTQTATSVSNTTAVTCTATVAIGDIIIFKRAKQGDDTASLFSTDVTSTGTGGVGLDWTRQAYVSEAGKSTVEIWTSSPAIAAGSAVVSSGTTSVANYKSAVLENWRGAAPFDGTQAVLTETGGDASPPPPETLFGFNSFASYNGYTQGTAESSTTMYNRLVNDFGPFAYIKQFQSGFLPTNFTSDTQGINSASCPADTVVQCFTWTHGSIASGSHDAALTTYINSVPVGKTVILCENEVDNHIGNNTDTTQWANYVADMDHLYDLVQTLSPAGTVEVWDCFMEFTLDPSTASNRQWRDFMTNPAKRNGYVWDNYWNNASTDTSGNTAIGYITAKMNHLGKTRWLIGETGDRRQEDAFTPAGNVGQSGHFASDSARATLLNNRISAVLAANPKPEAYIYFDLVGTTGDHRIVTLNGSGGPDVLTKAVLAGYMAAVA